MILANQQTMNYRQDIDGLRAIAVLAVVLYHYGIGGFQGGFVGVDVFFVISGYLITGIIHKEIGRSQFTFTGFYERRIRRIFPALFAMMLTTLIVGTALLLPSDLERLGNSTLATLFFGSNVLFWRQSGYFDSSSEYNPLLHTWSLSVEEQFYIGLPILLILLHRYAKNWLKTALVVCAIASFALCVWMQTLRPSATFFLLPFRAWELLLGGWLAIGVIPPIQEARVRLLVSTAALALLLCSLWWINSGPTFPGWQAALPVVATAALLHAGAQGSSPVQRLLSVKPLVFVGLISYSLYLWHWPLVVFVRYFNGMEPLTPGTSGLLLVIAILLATASYRWIETPLRRRQAGTASHPRNLFIGTAAVGCLLAGTALAVQVQDGWQTRFSPEVVALDKARHPVIPFRECDGRKPDFNSDACRVGVAGKAPSVLLWGDSHALAWAPGLDEILKQHGASGILAVNSACPPLFGVNNPMDMLCHSDNERLLSEIRDHRLDTIVIIASWSSYSDQAGKYTLFDDQGRVGNTNVFAPALGRTLSTINPLAERILLVGPTPGAPDDIPFRLAISKWQLRSPPDEKTTGQLLVQNENFWKTIARYRENPKISTIDPAPWFCDQHSCRYSTDDGKLLYRDGGHLSIVGAQFVASRIDLALLSRKNQFTPIVDSAL